MYDVIVIGAGPTGSSAANKLANSGYKVLLVEKFKMPRNKSCSGILIKKSVDLVKKYFDTYIPEYTMCTPRDSRGMIFTSDQGKEYCYEQDGLNIWRSPFDYFLTQKAVESGAELRDETAAISCDEGENYVAVTLKGNVKYIEKAKFVIACDGVVGSIKRKMIITPQNYITTFQTFNRGSIDLDYHYFYAYLQPKLSEYDAWFNVKDDYLIFGVSVKNASKINHYYNEFIAYMSQKHNAVIKEQVKNEKWLMPHIMAGCKIDYGKGRILFAGETAGFLNPMGEGISAGLESGYAGALAIINSDFNLQIVYEQYLKNTASLKFYMLRQWNFVGNIAATFDHMKL